MALSQKIDKLNKKLQRDKVTNVLDSSSDVKAPGQNMEVKLPAEYQILASGEKEK